MYQVWSKSIEGCWFYSVHKDVTEGRTVALLYPSQLCWRGDNKQCLCRSTDHWADYIINTLKMLIYKFYLMTLFKKRVVRTKFDIHVFFTITGSILLLVSN